jgi:DNA repair exonuclease SbcCD ATPase subunit
MVGNRVALSVVWVIGLVLMISMAHAADPNLTQVQEIMQSMQTIKNDIKKAEDEKTALAGEEKRLIETDELLKSAEKRFQNDAAALNLEWADYERQEQAHNAEGYAHGKKTGKKYWTGGDELSFPSMSQEWKNAYNERAARLYTRRENLKDRWKTLNEREKGLKESRDNLSKATLELTQKKKANDAKLNEAYARYTNLINFVRLMNNLPHSRMLIQKAGASEECSNIPGVENLEMYTSTGQVQLEGAAERAHRCLQRIWDGAK